MVRRISTKTKPQEFDLFGHPIEERSEVEQMQTLPYASARIRVVMKAGEPWWVLADVARVLGYSHGFHAARILADDEKGIHQTDTLGGSQEVTVVNESGLYRLIMRSNKEEAEAFRRWVFRDVLPQIRKTGSYRPSPVMKTMKRLGCDEATAVRRVEHAGLNKSLHGFLASLGAKPRDFQATHNHQHVAMVGRKAADMRKTMGLKKGTPIPDRMTPVVHAGYILATEITEKVARQNGTPLSEIPALAETIGKTVAKDMLRTIGPNTDFGLIEESRGLVIDVIQLPHLPSPSQVA
jgi:prophage antirepressor-like protein